VSDVRVLLVDDERPARQRLRRLLEAQGGVTIVAEAADGRAAVDAIREQQPDLVFLDVQMPRLDGFGVVAELGEPLPAIVFVTAFDEYAVKAFEVHALDYLLKPVAPERLAQVFERLGRPKAIERAGSLATRLDRLLETLDRRPRFLERILVSRGERSAFLKLDRVSHAEAARNYVSLHGPDGPHVVRGSLGALEARLDPARWVRVNRSTLVQIDAIAQVEPWFHGEFHLTLTGGAKVVWSRRFLTRADEVLGRKF
jgi:two-component system LytT family response regulator